MNLRKKLLLFGMVIGTCLTSGCWDKKELNDIALVSAIGLDKSEEGDLMGSFQIINPGNVAGALQGGGSGDKPPVTVFTSTGNNVLELDRVASSKLSRFMYLQHANLLVISEELAKEEGIISLLDAFDRSTNFRSTSKIVIALDVQAKDIIETLTSIDKVSADKVIKTLKSTEHELGESVSVDIQELIKNLVSSGREPVIGGFTIKKNDENKKKIEITSATTNPSSPKTSGVAIFKKGKLVDWMDAEKVRGMLWASNKIQMASLDIDWEDTKDAIDYQAIRQQTNLKVKMKNGKPKMFIKVRTEGNLQEVKVPLNLNETTVLTEIESELAKEIKKQMKAAIATAKENKADIFGFGDIVHQNEPKEWKKLKDDWHDVTFPTMEVDIQVKAFIRRTGLRNKPFITDLKNDK